MIHTDYELKRGAHTTPQDGMCAMEWVAHLAGEEHSDSPKCVAEDLRLLFVSLNDKLDDDERQLLRPYLTRCIGTATADHHNAMADRCVTTANWMVETALPQLFYTDPDAYYTALGWQPRVAGPASAQRCLTQSYLLPNITCGLLSAVVTGQALPPGFAEELTMWLQVTHKPERRWPCVAKLLDALLPLEPLELPGEALRYDQLAPWVEVGVNG